MKSQPVNKDWSIRLEQKKSMMTVDDSTRKEGERVKEKEREREREQD